MIKLNKVRLLKALTMTALFANEGIGADDEQSKNTGVSGGSYKFGSTSAESSNITGIILQQIRSLDERTINRQNILRSERTIDLTYKPFENVRNFLRNARLYQVKAKLRVLDVSQSQLNELFDHYSDAIEELNWTYRPASLTDQEDWGEETGTTGETTTTGFIDDDDDDDEDEDLTTTGFKTGDDWDNHIDGSGVAVPAPRRAVARMRNPLGLGDLIDNPWQEANLVPRNRLVLEPIAANAQAASANAQVAAANDQNEPDEGYNSTGKWRITLVSDEKANFNTTSIQPSKGAQPHALVKLFCRGNAVAVRS